jgi:hypothetical protein
MKRTAKKLSIRTTTIRALRVLSNEEAARVYGASLNGVCDSYSCYRETIGCCPTTSGH